MNLLFQPATGIQSSNLISESLDGLMVAATRQNAGKSLGGITASAPRGPALGKGTGGVNSWAATDWAAVIVVSGNFRDAMFSQVVAAWRPAADSAVNIVTHGLIDIFITGYLNTSHCAIHQG
jgi:hypothetical protein